MTTTQTNPERFGNSIATYTGRWFWPLDPQPEDIVIEDIAHALSNKCRFSGHTKKFFSVAQHSVIVSLICDPKDFLWGLLHDASEAYLVDMPKPLKILPEFEWFRKAEDKVQLAVCKRFNLSPEQPESTHVADKIALLTEKRDLMAEISYGRKWEENYNLSPLEQKIIAMQPEEARDYFLKRYYELTSKS
jgi:5'-deoxynucleotidase YfbR-like HD superfamily hydrolase